MTHSPRLHREQTRTRGRQCAAVALGLLEQYARGDEAELRGREAEQREIVEDGAEAREQAQLTARSEFVLFYFFVVFGLSRDFDTQRA